MAAGMMEAVQLLTGVVRAAESVDVEALYRRHAPFVWRIVRRFGVADTDVEDAVHEVFIVAHRRREDLRDPELARSWLFGIAKRVAMAQQRKRKRAAIELSSDPVSAGSSPEESTSTRERAALARRCLAKIDESRRMVFVLCELEQLSGPEVADALGIPLNTVYSRLRLAKREFADAAEEESR